MAAKERRVGSRASGPNARKGRRFTAARQELFFTELAATCNLTRSARRAGISRETVRKYRRENAAFRARWAETIREAYARLELTMLERMMVGTVKTVTRADGSVDKTHEYPNWIALRLLQLHRATVQEAEAIHDPEDVDEVRARIADKLTRLRKRLGVEEPTGTANEKAVDARAD